VCFGEEMGDTNALGGNDEITAITQYAEAGGAVSLSFSPSHTSSTEEENNHCPSP